MATQGGSTLTSEISTPAVVTSEESSATLTHSSTPSSSSSSATPRETARAKLLHSDYFTAIVHDLFQRPDYRDCELSYGNIGLLLFPWHQSHSYIGLSGDQHNHPLLKQTSHLRTSSTHTAGSVETSTLIISSSIHSTSSAPLSSSHSPTTHSTSTATQGSSTLTSEISIPALATTSSTHTAGSVETSTPIISSSIHSTSSAPLSSSHSPTTHSTSTATQGSPSLPHETSTLPALTSEQSSSTVIPSPLSFLTSSSARTTETASSPTGTSVSSSSPGTSPTVTSGSQETSTTIPSSSRHPTSGAPLASSHSTTTHSTPLTSEYIPPLPTATSTISTASPPTSPVGHSTPNASESGTSSPATHSGLSTPEVTSTQPPASSTLSSSPSWPRTTTGILPPSSQPPRPPGTSAPPRLTSTAAPSTTAAPITCLNNGTLVGNRCDCPPPFSGQRCENAMDEVPVATVVATIKVFVNVENVQFQKGMETPGSEAFGKFVKIFEQQMGLLYKDVPGYQGVRVIKLSNGSVNVDHDVLLDVTFSTYNASYASSVQNLTQVLEHNRCSSNNTQDRLCFKQSLTHVTRTFLSPADLSEECKKLVPPELQQYYMAVNISDKLQCVSNCSKWHPDPFECRNGTCHIEKEGPKCYVVTASPPTGTSVSSSSPGTSPTLTSGSLETSTPIPSSSRHPTSTQPPASSTLSSSPSGPRTTTGILPPSSQPPRPPGTSAPPRLTSTAAPSTTAAPITCLNNGTLVGNRCDCPPPFSGQRCENAMDEVPVATVVATINVFVNVENKQFQKGMETPGSEAFGKFVKIFEQQMGFLYKDVPGYKSVRVIKLSNGSVNVDHDVLLNVTFSTYNASYASSVQNLTQVLEHNRCSSNNTQDRLCFKHSLTRVTRTFLSPADLTRSCQELLAPDVCQYYVGRNLSNQLQCVSSCSLWHPDPFLCSNGKCYLQPGGAHCYCKQSDAYWFTGRRCEQRISKVGVAVGVALGLLVLLLVILLLAVLVCWKACCQKEKGDRPWSLPRDEEKLYENEAEWAAGPRGVALPSAPEPLDGGSGSTEEPESWSSSEQGSFRPRLDKVDTSLPRRIARPQLTHQ
ncbi:mucin-3B-like [Hemicordylus capensis]|uniref:mucin-3B-like n=1 Tax=Hemicordylus capensis TaxID=884348 RepID=UPI002303D93E|nr:mucin-3B-like [Hemicordylus capensis]